MTRKSTIHPVSIGNGLFVRTRRPEPIGEAYRCIQRTCIHERRDPNGTCYRCGHRMPYESVPEPRLTCGGGPDECACESEREKESSFRGHVLL
jgi:hypothetical protein